MTEEQSIMTFSYFTFRNNTLY